MLSKGLNDLGHYENYTAPGIDEAFPTRILTARVEFGIREVNQHELYGVVQ